MKRNVFIALDELFLNTVHRGSIASNLLCFVSLCNALKGCGGVRRCLQLHFYVKSQRTILLLIVCSFIEREI